MPLSPLVLRFNSLEKSPVVKIFTPAILRSSRSDEKMFDRKRRMHRTIISSDRVVFTEDSNCFNANFCKHFNPMTRFDALLVNIPPKLWDIFFLRVGVRFIWSRLTQIYVEYNFKEISLFCLIFMLAHFIGNTVSLLFQVIAFLLVEPSNPFRLVGIQINKCSLLVATWFFT